jgi:predicted ATPase
MPSVIITGGPGAGKTTLLRELGAMGYATVDETARTIIAHRRARGLSPRPTLSEFASEILRQDILKYVAQRETAEWTFFDRGIVDALGLLQDVSPMPDAEVDALLAKYPFHKQAFILPPWEAIYVNDAERDQSFADAVVVHDKIVRWYRACGYQLCEVPRLHAPQRAAHVLGVLNNSA